MAIPGDPMCGHVVREGHGHQVIYDFIEEAETDHRSSLLQRSACKEVTLVILA